MRHAGLAVALAVVLPACSGGPTVAFEAPAKDAMVADGADVWVRVRAEDYDAVELSVDGEKPVLLLGDGDGRFVAALPLAPGRHHLVATVPGITGAIDERDVWVARAPDAPVDGFGLTRSGSHALVLSDGRPADDGLYAGRLSVLTLSTANAPFETGLSRKISSDGVFGEVTDEGRLVWVDGWKDGRGTLHIGEIDRVEEQRSLRHVLDFKVARDGRTVGARDEDGVIVFDAATGESHRIVSSSRVFVFAGAGADLVSFDGEDETTERSVTFASPPEFVPVALAPPVLPVIGASPLRREAVFLEYRDTGIGPLLLYDFETRVTSAPFESVSGFTYSRSGEWLLALADTADEVASVGLWRRDVEGASPVVVDGEFVRAGFDHSGGRVYAIESGVEGTLFAASVVDEPPVFEQVAANISDIQALPDDRMLLLTSGGELALLGTDGAFAILGAWNPGAPQLSVAKDGATLAFTTVVGDRRPIRRVNLLTGAIADLGEDGVNPIALNGGAVAWSEAAGAAAGTRDLWLLPTFPASISGARPLAADVDLTLARSADGEWLATNASDRAICVDAGAHLKDLGAADAGRREMVFLGDGRLSRFGVDGSQKRAFFVQRCTP